MTVALRYCMNARVFFFFIFEAACVPVGLCLVEGWLAGCEQFFFVG